MLWSLIAQTKHTKEEKEAYAKYSCIQGVSNLPVNPNDVISRHQYFSVPI